MGVYGREKREREAMVEAIPGECNGHTADSSHGDCDYGEEKPD